MEKGVDPGNLVPRRNLVKYTVLVAIFTSMMKFLLLINLKNLNILSDELVSSVNDPSMLLMVNETNFVLQLFPLRTYIFKYKFLLDLFIHSKCGTSIVKINKPKNNH